MKTVKIKEKINEVQRRLDPDLLKSKLLAQPKKRWTISKADKKMISYNLVSEINPTIARRAANTMKLNNFVNFSNGHSNLLKVRQTKTITRMETGAKSMFGANFAFINDPAQGILYLDQTDCTYLHIGEDQMAKTEFGKIKGEITSIKKGKSKNQTVATLQIYSPTRAKQYLYFEEIDDCKDYSNQLFKSAFHCPTKLAKSGINCDKLLELGILTGGEFYTKSSSGEFQKASGFKIEKLKVEDYDKKYFDIPNDYDDYRDLKKKQKDPKERFKFGETIKISNLRKPKVPFNDNNYPPENDEIKGGRGENGANVATSYKAMSTTLTHRDEKNLNFPQCNPSTYGSQVANLVDQKLLDDARYIINGISRRLTSFQGVSGELDIDWLKQFEDHANAIGSGPGSGLFHLLRDVSGDGTGLLDRMAEAEARNLLIGGDLTILTLPAALLTSLNVVISDSSIAPADRYDRLNPTDQRDYREAFLEQRIAHIVLDYPGNVPTQTVLEGLLNIRVDDIEFHLNIDNTSIMPTLNFENDFIHMVLDFPEAGGRATISRWPTLKYFGVLGLGGLACFFFPPACVLIAIAATIATFLSVDINDVDLEISNLNIDVEIRFLPNSNNVLQPDVTLALDGDVDFSFSSRIPTGIHQIIALIVQIVGNQTDIIINTIESQAQEKLNDFIKQDLAITYPPKFGPVALSGINNFTSFVVDESMYIQTRLDAGTLGVINPYITQVDSQIHNNLLEMRNQFKLKFTDPVDKFNEPGVSLLNWVGQDFETVARFYLGSVLSQNFINHYIHTLWRKHDFTYLLSDGEKGEIINILKEKLPELAEINVADILMAIWPATSPRTVFTPRLIGIDGRYATSFFDDMRLCIALPRKDKKLQRMEFLFASQLYTEIGFGGIANGGDKLDLIKIDEKVFDLYFDLDNIGVEIIHPEIQSITTSDATFDADYDYSLLDTAELQETLRLAVYFALKNKNIELIPKSSVEGNVHLYNMGTPAIQMLTQLIPFNQNLYICMGTTGPATAVYEGALDIDNMEQLTAQLIRLVI